MYTYIYTAWSNAALCCGLRCAFLYVLVWCFLSLSPPHVTGQPADDGDGDWAPGMRRSAMAQLKEEEAQAKQTAKEASDEDADSAY